jgi:hypothetical protein
MLTDTSDSLVYNYNETQLVVTIDMEDILVVTPGRIARAKTSVPKVRNSSNRCREPIMTTLT